MQHFRLHGQFRANYFQGDEAIELAIFRAIDGAHAALAEQIDDFVAGAEDRAGNDLRGAARGDSRIRDATSRWARLWRES